MILYKINNHSISLDKLANASAFMNEVVESRDGSWLRKHLLSTMKAITNMRVIISGTITYGLKVEV